MDTSYLFSELLLVPGTLLVMGIGYYIQNLHKQVDTMMSEEEVTEAINDSEAVWTAVTTGLKDRIDRVESTLDRVEGKLDSLLLTLSSQIDKRTD